jgi:Zn-dependent M28 family amino/carboxypeptidase
MARALVPAQPERTFVFMCYAGEEQGLYGSYAHVDALAAGGDLAKLRAVVVMDMIGYSADAHLDADYESYASMSTYTQQFGAAAATYAPDLHIVFQTNPWGSDHVPYLEAGVPTVLAIESDYDAYPDYHRATDVPAAIGPHAQAMGGAILKANVAALAVIGGAHAVDDTIFADGWDG